MGEKKQLENELTREQQELINLIYHEVSELLVKQIKLASNLESFENDHPQLLEILETQIEHVNRIGSAARIIGLHGLHQFCNYMRGNFTHIQKNNPNKLISLRSKILYWPDVIQTYLVSPTDPDYIQAALDYLSQKELPVNLSQAQLSRVGSQFTKSKVEIDTRSGDRIREATPELVTLKLSEEIQTDLFNSFMLDLPRQTEELSNSVHKLQNKDFLKQLEISERIAHNLKGAGNTAGIKGIANLTHHMEDIFAALQKAKMKPSNYLLQAIQNAADCLEEMSEYLQGLGAFPNQSVQVLQEILNWANKIDIYGVDEYIEHDVKSEVSQYSTESSPPIQEQIDNINTASDTHIDPSLQISAHLIDDLLKRAGENIISNEQIKEIVLRLSSSVQRLGASNKKIKVLTQELGNLIEIRGTSSDLKLPVMDEKFDPLEIEQFNELHTFTNQLIESADDSFEFANEIEESLFKLEELSVNQVRNLHENQEAVMRVRMIPVQNILPRLKRAVRQACKLSGNSAQLEITGEQTLIDSEFIHQLVDPVMHILRNAIDHGIETSAKRISNGKDSEGKIHLSFKKEGNLIRVTCKDDGDGLDLERIKLKAIDCGILDKNEELSKERAIQIILQHGFTTKDKVSQLSGRGVGLAAAFSKIHEMKGSIHIDTNKGSGLIVEISIPTSINSVHALIVRCADSTVAISDRGVDEILYSGAGEIIYESGKYYFEYMQHRYPAFDLQFMLEKTEKNTPVSNKISLIITDDKNKKYAVVIDQIYDTRDIVTKPLSKYIPKVLGLLGTTILGNGSVTTVIDIVELLKNSNALSKENSFSKSIDKSEKHHRYALIVEDAISTRKLLAQFMRDLGFVVNTAKDGVEAIQQIQKQTPSIVLTDLEMPRMNGLELSDHLRSNEDTAFTPIIMITSKSTEKHRKEARRLGVSAYITKPYNEDVLLELINSFKVTA